MTLDYAIRPLRPTADDWAALETERRRGVCLRCRFEFEPDDCYIWFGDGRGYCEGCHAYRVGDLSRVPKNVQQDIARPEPTDWVNRSQGKDPRAGASE